MAIDPCFYQTVIAAFFCLSTLSSPYYSLPTFLSFHIFTRGRIGRGTLDNTVPDGMRRTLGTSSVLRCWYDESRLPSRRWPDEPCIDRVLYIRVVYMADGRTRAVDVRRTDDREEPGQRT